MTHLASAMLQNEEFADFDPSDFFLVALEEAISEKIEGSVGDAARRGGIYYDVEGASDRLLEQVNFVRPVWIGEIYISSIHALQEWEGYVTAVAPEIFTARLLDLTAGATAEQEIVEFSLSEISEGDRDLLREGAVFRWVIGTQITRSGQRRRVSQISFRRLPAWTISDVAEARAQAVSISQIGWD